MSSLSNKKKLKPRELRQRVHELEVSESSKAKELFAKQSKKILTERLKGNALKQGQTRSVFMMSGLVEGNKKAKQDAHAVNNKETGEIYLREDMKRSRNPGLRVTVTQTETSKSSSEACPSCVCST